MEARAAEWLREHTYRLYVTDALKVLGDFNERYADLINNKPGTEDSRTAEDIITHIKDKLRSMQGR